MKTKSLILPCLAAAVAVALMISLRYGSQESTGVLAEAPIPPERVGRLEGLEHALSQERNVVQLPLSASNPIESACTVVVSDSHGRSLAGVHILIFHEGDATSVGLTDADGRARVTALSQVVDGDFVVAVKEGFACAQHSIAPTCHDDIRLVLEQGERIAGSVVTSSRGIMDPTSITVVAIPRTVMMVGSANAWKRLLLDPRVLVTRCEADGSFALENARLDAAYTVTAGGNGWIDESAGELALSKEPIVISVAPLFGVSVQLVDSEGEPITPVFQAAPHGWSSMVQTSGARSCMATMPARILAGMPLEWARPFTSQIVVMALSDNQTTKVGPTRLIIDFIGYEKLETYVDLYSLADGGKSVDFKLKSTASGWGRVDVEFRDGHDTCYGCDGPGILMLRNSLGEHMRLPVQFVERQHSMIGPLPAGHYDWCFVWNPETPASVRREKEWGAVDIKPDSVAKVRPASNRTGSVKLEFTTRNGDRYSGPVSVTVGEISDATNIPGATHVITGSSLHFARDPYSIPVLPPGPVDLQVTFPHCENGGRRSVEVQQDASASVGFVVH